MKRSIKHTNTEKKATSSEFVVCSIDGCCCERSAEMNFHSTLVPNGRELLFFSPWIAYNQSVKAALVSYFPLQTPPLRLFPTDSPLFLSLLFNHQVPQQMAPGSTTAKLVGALLESSHTWLGQHLFMNGPTITHPPDIYSWLRSWWWRWWGERPKSKRRDKTRQGSDTRGDSDKDTCQRGFIQSLLEILDWMYGWCNR